MTFALINSFRFSQEEAGPYLEVGQRGVVALPRFEEKYKLPLKGVV